MNRARLNLLLGMALVLLGGLALWDARRGDPPAPTLSGPPADAVEAIRIESPQGGVRLERVGGRWQVAGDPPLPAAQGRVERLLALARARIERDYPADRADPAQLGLAPPKAVVSWAPDGFRIEIGGTDPVEGLRYVRAGDRIALVSSWEAEAALGRLEDFVSRRLLPEGAEPVEIRTPGVHLRKTEEGWVAEGRSGISRDRINEYLDAWRFARAISVTRLKGPPPRELPEWRVRLADGTDRRFLLEAPGGRPPRLLLPDLHLAYEITAALRDRLAELPGGAAPGQEGDGKEAAEGAPVEAQ